MVDVNSLEKQLPEGAKSFIQVVVDAGEAASVSTIREQTTLTRAQVRYRFERLQEMGIIELRRDPSGTPQNVAPLKIAVLTDFGREVIDEGFLAEEPDYMSESAKIEQRLNELESRLDLVESKIGERTLADHQDLDALWGEIEELLNT